MFRSRLQRSLLGASVMILLTGLLAVMGYSPAQANHSGATLQAAPDVQFANIGGEAIITAYLSAAAGETPIQIDAEVEGGGADTDGNTPDSPDAGCVVAPEARSCQFAVRGGTFGAIGERSGASSLVRTWIDHDGLDGDEPGGVTEADLREGRLSSAEYDPDPRPGHPSVSNPLGFPQPARADCLNPEDYGVLDFPGTADCGVNADGSLDDGVTVQPGGRGEQDLTDVVLVQFRTTLAGLDCDIANTTNVSRTSGPDSATLHPRLTTLEVLCTAHDSVGAPEEGRWVDAENISRNDGTMDQSGANDPQPGTDGSADYDSSDTGCSTDANGQCTIEIQSFNSGPAVICFWVDPPIEFPESELGEDDDTYDPEGAEGDGGGCDDERVADPEFDDLTDTIRVEWADNPPVLTGVDLEPESATNRPNGFAFVTARTTDQYGNTYTPSNEIKFELYGGSPSDTDGHAPEAVATPDKTCTTTSTTGQCSIELSSPAEGTDILCGWIGVNPSMVGTRPDVTCAGESQSGTEVPRVDVVSVTWRTPSSGGDPTPNPGPNQPTEEGDVAQDDSGYRFVASDGGVFVFGDRGFHGSLGDRPLNKPIVGGATNPRTNEGYWMVASDGGVFSFGDAGFFGSLAGQTLESPIVEIEPTPTGQGYFMVDSKGRVYPFGDAATGIPDARSIELNKAIIGMSVTSSGKGYWLVASDGGIFTFGDADFYGSMGDQSLNSPVIDLAPTPDSNGYHLVAGDGGIFSFGNAEFKGSTGNIKLNKPAVAMLVAPNGAGYWIIASDGGVFAFGAVPFHGSTGNITLNSPVLDAIH